MKILVACEESQAVTIELRKLGHEAYSCDIIDCSGGHPEWHIKWDVLPLLNGKCSFITLDGKLHWIDGRWDMIFFFPPCTFLTNTGNRWFDVEKYGERAIQRLKARQEAAEFFMAGWNADCDRVVIENPIGYMSTYFRKPDQIVHPYYFAKEDGDANCERKATCVWFRGVNPLKYEIRFQPRVIVYKNGKGTDSPWHMNTMKLPPDERAKKQNLPRHRQGNGRAVGWKGGGCGMMLDDVIEIKIPAPDSQYRLVPCKKCQSDNVAYEHYNGKGGAKWRVKCFDCGYTVDKGNKVRHDAQLNWNKDMRP